MSKIGMAWRRSAQAVRVVIPAFNAAHTLEALVHEICQFVAIEQVIVVDDGSSDATAAVARRLGTRLLIHPANMGKGAAVRHGLEEGFTDPSVDACVTMDADGQHEARFIPDFLAAWSSRRGGQAEVIIGARRLHPAVMPWPRVLSNRITSFLLSARIGQKIADSQCGYRLITRKAFAVLNLQSAGYEMESELLLQAGKARLRISSIPISTVYGREKSAIRGVRDTWRFIRTYLSAGILLAPFFAS